MSRYSGPSSVPSGQPMSTVGGYQATGMPGHMSSPQTVPPYNVAVASPLQYGQQQGPGPSPTPPHYPHPSPQQPMMTAPGGYGQPMMHGIMQPQVVMPPQPPQPQQPPQQQVPQQPGVPDDLGAKVKRAYNNFESNLKGFLHDYSTILQMDDARLNSQTPEALAQFSQNLVRRYETLLVTLDLFELNLRMLQDYSSTQNDFRRLVYPVASDPRRGMTGGQGSMDPSSHPGHPQFQGLTQIGRPVDPTQYQILLNKMQSQLDSFNCVRELGKKFLESSSSTATANTTTK